MTVRILASVAGTIAAPLIGGLAYRKVRQRRVAKALMIGRPAPELTNLCATPAGTTTTWPPAHTLFEPFRQLARRGQSQSRLAAAARAGKRQQAGLPQ